MASKRPQKPADGRAVSAAPDTHDTRPTAVSDAPNAAGSLSGFDGDALATLQRIAVETLAAVAADSDAPAAARAQAARTLAELTGMLGRHAEPPQTRATKNPAEMTLDEIDAAIAACDGA